MNDEGLHMPTGPGHGPNRGAERYAWIVGIIGLALVGLGAVMSFPQFAQSYLFGLLFWAWVALGCFGLLMLHGLLGAPWTATIRAPLEAAAKTIPWLGLFFIPVLFAVRTLYPWAGPDALHDEAIARKEAYLNVPFFVVRAVLYFVIWSGFLYAYFKKSQRRDEEATPAAEADLRVLSAPAILLYVATVTLASVDWIMSLDPHWYSTIFGAIVVGGQGISAISFLMVIGLFFAHSAPARAAAARRHDLGNMLLAFVLLWSYFSFSQYLIIYSGNIAEEVTWYIERGRGVWRFVSTSLIAFHFALPFLVLLFRRVKRNVKPLGVLAAFILIMRVVEVYWLTAPSFHGGAFAPSWMDFAALAGIGGVWFALFLRGGGALAEPRRVARVMAR